MTLLRRAFLTSCVPVFLISCRNSEYRVPVQYTMRKVPVKAVLVMKSGIAEQPWARIVSGIIPGDPKSDWRWTAGNPQLRFQVTGAESKTATWNFVAEFFTISTVLDSTGPQRITVLLNSVERHRLVVREPKDVTIQFPVPPDIVGSGRAIDVQLSIDPVLNQSGGGKLGVLLHYIGFVQDAPS